MATSLVAVAVPAYADTSQSGSAPSTAAQLSPSPSPSPSDTAGTASTKSASTQSSASSPLDPSSMGLSAGDASQLTDVISQLQSASGGSSSPPIPGLDTLSTCVSGQLTGLQSGTPPDGVKIEGCFSTFFQTLTGQPQAKCLDPLLQGLIGGLQALPKDQGKSLQAFLTDLPNTLQAIPTCLQPAASPSPTPTPTPTPSTTEASAPATTDSTAAVPVSATPTFTG